MTDPLIAAESYLLQRYRALNGDQSWAFTGEMTGRRRAAWIWQSQDLQDTSCLDSASGALIADPDVGICLYLVNFRHQPKVRETIARALAVQQRLMPLPRGQGLPVDELGEWRVAVNWLVESADLPAWIEQVADIRERTGHFEEISADVVIRHESDWSDACEKHGFPRLLFALRELLAKRSAIEIDQWQSVDAPVAEQLRLMPSQFQDPLVRQCAQETLKRAFQQDEHEAPQARVDTPSIDVFELGVRHFRNIDKVDIQFRTPSEKVSATIIHGPNGSGKSSIFEALSFALCGTSLRYSMYLRDGNRSLWGKRDQYVSEYLQRRQNGSAELPIVHLNGAAKSISPEELTKCQDRGDDLGNNVFSQECSRSLVGMPASELGAQIAGAFSRLAANASDFVEGALKAAQEQQRIFNHDWGLRGNVTKRETVLESVVLRLLRPQLSKVDSLIAWLNGGVGEGPLIAGMRDYAFRLSQWRDEGAKRARSGTFEYLEEYLQRGKSLFAQVNSFIDGLAATVERWPEDIAQSWNTLSTWLKARADGPRSSAEVAVVEKSLAELQEQLRSCLDRGNLLRAHKQSLDAVVALLPQWSASHDKNCPTCGTDLCERGGIQKVLSEQIALVEKDLEQTRVEYKKISGDIEQTSDHLARMGALEPPIPAEVQVELTAALELIGVSASSTLNLDRTATERIGALLLHLRRVPRFGLELPDPDLLASQVREGAEEVGAEYERVANLPAAWKKVRDELQSRLAGVTAKHLPSTVQALWNEFAQNMLPAPWQYPGRLGLKIATSKAGAEVAVVIRTEPSGEALAAHLLNGAEVHNVGLAWFLTQYTLRGRFNFRALVFDDPAHAMDQPTFREFCRLLETLMRLHRVNDIPLSLVLLLHQDGRAVDATRATNGTLHHLRWNYHTPVSLRRVKLHDESVVAPQPVQSIRAIRSIG